MRRLVSLVLAFLLLAGPITAQASSYLLDEPYMTLEIFGFTDRDGRIILRMTRRYYNPVNQDISISDWVNFSRANAMREIIVVDKSPGVQVEKEDDGRQRIEVETGLGSGEYVVFDIELRDLMGGSAGRDGRNHSFTFNIDAPVPMMRYFIRFDIPDVAVNHDSSYLALRAWENGEPEGINITPNVRRGSQLQSIAWNVNPESHEDLHRYNDISLFLNYSIPDAVRHTRYIQGFAFIALAVIGLTIAVFRLWKKVKALEGKAS